MLNIKQLQFLVLITLGIACKPAPPTYQLTGQNTKTNALLIGLHAINEQIVWASGTNSTVIRTLDGGQAWEQYQLAREDSLQFRDIHGIDTNNAIVLSIGEGPASRIYHFNTQTGWSENFRMADSAGFLDAFDFWSNGYGIAYGDAIDSIPYILKTEDWGNTWKRITGANMPKAGKGEGGFASSGTCVITGKKGKVWIGTGAGGNARMLFSADYGSSWQSFKTPMVKGDAAGITTVRFDGNVGIIAGGDLTKSQEWSENLFWTDTNGKSWYPLPQPKTPGAFYGSGFAKINGSYVSLVCGPEGADLSMSLGEQWVKISPDDLWTATLLPSGTGWIAGKGGNMLRIDVAPK
ncbi:MAG: photosystem II stability/assembly factor-like uncharacterized protein [Cyclobacteriaceae bacterium]|jgi:photosystem II stability/assembly factor-like uncharacterized protein